MDIIERKEKAMYEQENQFESEEVYEIKEAFMSRNIQKKILRMDFEWEKQASFFRNLCEEWVNAVRMDLFLVSSSQQERQRKNIDLKPRERRKNVAMESIRKMNEEEGIKRVPNENLAMESIRKMNKEEGIKRVPNGKEVSYKTDTAARFIIDNCGRKKVSSDFQQFTSLQQHLSSERNRLNHSSCHDRALLLIHKSKFSDPPLLMYISELSIFIFRFLHSCSFILYFDCLETALLLKVIFYNRMLLFFSCLLRPIIFENKLYFNLFNFSKCLSPLKTFICPKGYVFYNEKKSLASSYIYVKNEECRIFEECSDFDKVVKLREQPRENQVCSNSKQFYGDVDLQTRSFENDRTPFSKNCEQSVDSKDNKSQDDGLNSLKRMVRNKTELPHEKQRHVSLTVAPVTKPKRRQKRRPHESDDLQDSHSQPNEDTDAAGNEGPQTSASPRYNTTELDRVPSVSENAMPQVHTDGIEYMNPSSNMPLENVNVEKKTTDGGACSAASLEHNSKDAHVCDMPSEKINSSSSTEGCANNQVGTLQGDITVAHVSMQHPVENEVSAHTTRQPRDYSSYQIDIKLPSYASENSNNSALGVPVTSDSNLTTQIQSVDDSNSQRFESMTNIIDKIADGERVPPEVTMRYEMLRFCTLRSFPKENKPFISRIAAAGFYYANTGDEVVCYSCARRKSNWREDDDPMEIHRQLNPNCSYLLRNLEVNVPVKAAVLSDSASSNVRTNESPTQRKNVELRTLRTDATPNSISSVVSNSDNVNVLPSSSSSPGLLSDKIRTRALAQQVRAHGSFVSTNSDTALSSAGQSSTDLQNTQESRTRQTLSNGSQDNNTAASSNETFPKYPRYASKPARLASYNDCGDIIITPDSLATAGFFYAGFGDCVRCFSCGIGLRHWSDEDDPWIEHSRWSKDCLFVKQVKGQEFVNLVQMAVQYSQNQNSDREIGTNIPAEPSGEASNRNEMENLMHTDAAQSVLEMGYHPDVIRRAIGAIKDSNSEVTISATNLMEKIFEFEDLSDNENAGATSNPVENGVSSNQSNRESPNIGTSNSGHDTAVRRDSTVEPASNGVPVGFENQTTSSVTASSGAMVARSERRGASLSETLSRKSQLLEQKKLQEENKQLKQQSLCIKCLKNDVCIVFLPCGHLATCETCAPTIRYCTVEGCGKYIKGTVRTYLA